MCGGPDPKKEARKAEKRAREQARRHAEAMRKQDEQNQKMIANMEKQAAANVRRQELATSNMMKKNEKARRFRPQSLRSVHLQPSFVSPLLTLASLAAAVDRTLLEKLNHDSSY